MALPTGAPAGCAAWAAGAGCVISASPTKIFLNHARRPPLALRSAAAGSGAGAAGATGSGCERIGAGVLGNSAATAGTSAGGRLSRVLPGSTGSDAVGMR